MKKIIFVFIAYLFFAFPRAESFAQNLDTKNLFIKGQQYQQQGQYSKAIEVYERIVDQDPNFAPAYNALGLAHNMQNEKVTDVAWFFKVAIDIEPNYFEAYDNMCKVYYQAGLFDQAIKACLGALKVNPGYGSSQLTLAWIYLAESHPSQAIYYFTQVLERVKSPIIYYGLGNAYLIQGDRARVLDTITNLRSLGADEYAVKLEHGLRLSQPPLDLSQLRPRRPEKPSSQPGILVGKDGATQKSPTYSPPAGYSGQGGTMKIRLRGSLSNFQEGGNPSAPRSRQPPSPPVKHHPGSL